jgi:hypothetical protein
MGCIVLALTLPPASVLAGSVVLGAGAVVRVVVQRRRDGLETSRVR